DRPLSGPLERLLLVAAGVDEGRQLVEGEHDIGADLVLDAHRDLRGEAVHRPVEVGFEGHPVVIDVRQPLLAHGHELIAALAGGLHRDDLLEPRTQAHDLEAAGVGERRAGPVHELPQTAGLIDEVRSGLQVEVVGVGQHRLPAELGDLVGADGLDRGLRADRDERRGLAPGVRGADDTGAAARVRARAHPEAELRTVVDGCGCRRGFHCSPRTSLTKTMTFTQMLTAAEATGPIIIDGGLGTAAEDRGIDLDHDLWSAELIRRSPEALAEVHADFAAAGARILTTASYQASPLGFAGAAISLEDGRRLIADSVNIARSAAEATGGPRALIAGSVGPYGAGLGDGAEYTGDYRLTAGEYAEFHRLRIDALAEAGADLLAIETQPRLDEIRTVIGLAEEIRLPAWLSVSLR